MNPKQTRSETVEAKHYRYTAVFELAEEGGYIVRVPALGCATQGETLEEARVMAKECIEGYLEALVELGQEIPTEADGSFAETVEAEVSSRR